MKIKFYTEGGKNLGFGHINRCLSLAQAFNELNQECAFSILGDDSIKNLIDGFKVNIFDWVSKSNYIIEGMNQDEILIFDSYKVPLKLINDIAKVNKNLIFFDDYDRIKYPTGFVINGSLIAEDIYSNKDSRIKYLLGSQFQTLRKEFWDVVISKKNPSIENVLITFGGDDSRNLTPEVINFLNEYKPYLNKNVIVGKSFANMEMINSLKTINTNIIFDPNAEKICELMQKSDIAICGAGQTLYELARTKTPTLFLGIADNQINNIKSWSNYPYFKFVGWWNSDDIIGRLRESFIQFDNNFKNIAEKIYSADLIIDGNGSKNIVKEILSYVRTN